MQRIVTRGSIPDIINNKEGLYEGNLVYYFQIIFGNTRSLCNRYHNFNHLFHTLWLCYQACIFYKNELTPRERRNLLIAALFHDFDHSGTAAADHLNIERSIKGFEECAIREDQAEFNNICDIIRASEFPHKGLSEFLPLSCRIIRDADLCQGLDVTWIQQVIFGLAIEQGKKPIEVLANQIIFLSNLNFSTEWAMRTFPKEAIEDKISEVKDLLEILRTEVCDS